MIHITKKEFELVKSILYKKTGVMLKETKKPLVMARLRSRLESLEMETFSQYIPLLEKPHSEELETFINALTTNETYFFRHTKQFNYLFETILPSVKEKKEKSGNNTIQIWTAACSTGEEPYSIAIAAKEFFKNTPQFNVKIYASDINSIVLETAKMGIYSERSLKELPKSLFKKYFTDYEDENVKKGKLFKVSKSIIDSVEFFQHNLMNSSSKSNIDIVFLRNVMIYFDSDSKQQVVRHIQSSLAPKGYLFISLSETLNDIRTAFKMIFSGVYQKDKE